MPRKRTGPPYRRLVVTYWNDPEVKRLPLEDKAVLAYLFTNEHSHPCGVYRLAPIYVQDELGVDVLRMEALFAGPLAPFAVYDWETEEVFVRSMARYQIDGGLHGQDKRIGWVVAQLEKVRSLDLVRAFRHHETYRTWNLDLSAFLPGDVPGPLNLISGPPPEPAPSLKREGASPGPSLALPGDPLEPEDENGGTKPKGKGHGKPVPAPVPDPDPVGKPPAYARTHEGGEGREVIHDKPGEQRDPHPDLDRLWSSELKDAIHTTWHHGQDRVELDEKSVGVGLEYWLLNDLLHYDGDPARVAFMVRFAPDRLGWSSEPRTLYWLHRAENYHAAVKLAREAEGPGQRAPVSVTLGRMPAVTHEDIERERAR